MVASDAVRGDEAARRSERSGRRRARTPVFLSAPTPVSTAQRQFLGHLCNCLGRRHLDPRTLGVTDYDTREPLAGVYSVLVQCYGLVAVAFARTEIKSGEILREWRSDEDWSDQDAAERRVDGMRFTSPWAHIEAAMAYALGLPMIILRERGVYDDGVLQRGVAGIYLPEFDVDGDVKAYLREGKTEGYLDSWTDLVRSAVRHRTGPPRLY